MGHIEAMAISNVLPSGVLIFGSPIGLWAVLMSLLLASVTGIWLAVPRPGRDTNGRLVRSVRAAALQLLSAEL